MKRTLIHFLSSENKEKLYDKYKKELLKNYNIRKKESGFEILDTGQYIKINFDSRKTFMNDIQDDFIKCNTKYDGKTQLYNLNKNVAYIESNVISKIIGLFENGIVLIKDIYICLIEFFDYDIDLDAYLNKKKLNKYNFISIEKLFNDIDMHNSKNICNWTSKNNDRLFITYDNRNNNIYFNYDIDYYGINNNQFNKLIDITEVEKIIHNIGNNSIRDQYTNNILQNEELIKLPNYKFKYNLNLFTDLVNEKIDISNYKNYGWRKNEIILAIKKSFEIETKNNGYKNKPVVNLISKLWENESISEITKYINESNYTVIINSIYNVYDFDLVITDWDSNVIAYIDSKITFKNFNYKDSMFFKLSVDQFKKYYKMCNNNITPLFLYVDDVLNSFKSNKVVIDMNKVFNNFIFNDNSKTNNRNDFINNYNTYISKLNNINIDKNLSSDIIVDDKYVCIPYNLYSCNLQNIFK